MAQVIYTETGDEIVDLVEKVRGSDAGDVALVLNPGTTGFQTPLNVRLLRQLGSQADKTVSVISGDPHIQALSRVGGLPTYASVPAFERGIQTVRPHADDTGIPRVIGAAGVLAPPPPPPLPGAVAAGASARGRFAGRRRPLYFVAAGLVVVGLILFLFVAPSAKVTITLAGTPVSASPTIQGSTDPANAGQADHIVTSVVTSDQSAQFTATPTGKQQVPASAAKATLVFSTDLPIGAQFPVQKNDRFETQDNPPIVFLATASTVICIVPPGATCANGAQPNNSVSVADGTPDAKGNVAANTITVWPENVCATATAPCSPSDITVTNPAPATGGADATTNTVASKSDVSAWNAQVAKSEQTLTAQANQDLQSKAAGKTLAKDPGGNGSSVACTVTPPVPAVNAVFATAQVVVACQGKATVYNPADVSRDVRADLQSQVAQGDLLAPDSITCSRQTVTQASDDGTVVLSMQCTSFSRPAIDLEGLKTQLTGKSASDARNIIEHRLNRVQGVSVSQSPIPLFWLPFFASRISIDETFVTQNSR